MLNEREKKSVSDEERLNLHMHETKRCTRWTRQQQKQKQNSQCIAVCSAMRGKKCRYCVHVITVSSADVFFFKMRRAIPSSQLTSPTYLPTYLASRTSHCVVIMHPLMLFRISTFFAQFLIFDLWASHKMQLRLGSSVSCTCISCTHRGSIRNCRVYRLANHSKWIKNLSEY